MKKIKQNPIEQGWPASKVEMWPIGKIIPYPQNPRTHTEEQIKLIASSMKDDGVIAPILVDENGVIIYGHGRREAAIESGFNNYPVCIARGWSEKRKRSVRIKDNSLSLLSGWDTSLLRIEVNDLKMAGYEIDLLGFSDKQIASYLPEPAAPQNPNEIVEPPKKPIVRPGDIWILGEHRILNGDTTEAKSWDLLMQGEKASMVFTDPPYGVSYEAASGEFEVIQGDRKRQDDLYQMLVKSISLMAKNTSKRGAIYIWHASATRNDFAQAITTSGLIEKQYLIWAKPSMVLGRADYQWSHEPCFYCAHEGSSPEFYGDRTGTTVWRVEPIRTAQAAALLGSGIVVLDGNGNTMFLQARAPKTKKVREIRLTEQAPTLMISDPTGSGTVWEVSRDSGGYIHPTQKPVELATRAIENSSLPGEIVVDGFSGSGTTLIGCEMTGRRARVIDIDPRYVQAAVERWQRFTQGQATLEGDGRTFAEVAKDRIKTGAGKASGKTPGDPPKRRARSPAASPS